MKREARLPISAGFPQEGSDCLFIWDFVAKTGLDEILDWIYGQIIGFLGNFFAEMGGMGVELFEMPWVQNVVGFFSNLA